MEKLRNITFSVVIAIVLCGAIAYTVADKVFPSVDMPNRSVLESRKYVKLDKLVKSSFSEGEFQSTFERFTADRVPFREQLILFSAGLQRLGIKTAATMVGYTIYPTFFDSEYAYDEEHNFIFKTASGLPKTNANAKLLAKTINQAAEQHPDVRFIVDQTLRNQHMKANPTHSLITQKDLMDSDWIQENFINRLDEDIIARVECCDDLEELLNGWFNTDIHWTPKRALDSYNWIADELELMRVNWNDYEEITASESWYGSNARFARDIGVTSPLIDINVEFPNLAFHKLTGKGAGESFDPGLRKKVLAGEYDLNSRKLQHEAYTHYFGGSKPAFVTNSGDSNGKTCLFVTDSFGYCLTRYVANNYAQTIIIYPGNEETKHDLNWFIDTYGIDDVIVLTHGKKYSDIAETSPKFIGKE